MFFDNSKGQGTIEYLVIIGIVVVISLVVTEVIMSPVGSSSDVSSTASEILLKTGVNGVGIGESVAGLDENGLIVLKNIGSETITINSINIDGVDRNFSNIQLAMGSQKGFKLQDIDGCDGTRKSYSVKIYFTSANGLSKTADFENIVIECTDVVNPSGNFVEETNDNFEEPVLTYTVTFDTDGGSVVSPISGIVSGGTVNLPTDPTKANESISSWVFSGWYTQVNGEGTQFTNSTPVVADINVYAKWTTFYLGAGTLADPYQIYNWTQLNNMRNDLNANYILLSDLNSSTSDFAVLSTWLPMGDCGADYDCRFDINDQNMFTGSLDGDDHLIDSNGSNATALFTTTGNSASVSNLRLNSINLVGASSESGQTWSAGSFAAGNFDNIIVTGDNNGWGDGTSEWFFGWRCNYLTMNDWDFMSDLNFTLSDSNIALLSYNSNCFSSGSLQSYYVGTYYGVGTVSLIGNTFDESGYGAGFWFYGVSSDPKGEFNIINNIFMRTTNQNVRQYGNRLYNINKATLSGNTFENGAYLDIMPYTISNPNIIFTGTNTFNTINNGWGIRVLYSISPSIQTIVIGSDATLNFSGPGVPIRYVYPFPGSFTLDGNSSGASIVVNGLSYKILIAGGQASDIITGNSTNDGVYGDDGSDQISGLAGVDYLSGGAGNDTLIGGDGADTLTGNSGGDKFQWASGDDSDTITDFSTTYDQMALYDTFDNTSPGNTLAAADYVSLASTAAILPSHSRKVIEITTSQPITTINSFTRAGVTNAYVLVFNSTTNNGQLYFDADWGNTAVRQKVATFTNITTLDGITAFTNTNFFAD